MMDSNFKEKMSQLIGSLYTLHNISWKDKVGGFSAVNYEINANSTAYILKKYRSINELDVERIERVNDFLNAHGVPVALPLRSAKQKQHFMFGVGIFTLYPKIPGHILHEPMLKDQALLSVAALLAKIHRLNPTSLRLDTIVKRTLSIKKIEDHARKMIALIEKYPLGKNPDALAKELIHAKLEALQGFASLSRFYPFLTEREFVHGDFHNENILFDENQGIIGLLDFEKTYQGHRVADVMHFILLGCCNTGFEASNLRNARFFMQAYQTAFPLTAKEIEFGINYELFKEYSSFFLERTLYETRDLSFLKLLERDLRKLYYFKQHLGTFLNHLILSTTPP